MTVSSDHVSLTAAPAGYADGREIDVFVETLRRFERGEIDAEQWRAYRVVRGAYSQRQGGVHMLRIRIPQGVAGASQLRALADVAARFSRGYGHVTTRQNFQVHFVRPSDLEAALRRLAAAGITTHGAGGNAVRNVVACPLAGVAADEAFDVTPYADALTRHFLRHPLAVSLPRKLKIAFEGCGHDHVATGIQDLGFRAKVRREGGAVRRGFSVTVAGGTSSLCTSGSLLVEFLPATEVLAVAEAVVRVFHARGDRVNKQRNRLKFLVRQLGLDGFRALFAAELERAREGGPPSLPFDPERTPEERPPSHVRPTPPSPEAIAARLASAPPRGPGEPPAIASDLAPAPGALERFVATNVRRQRQRGYAMVGLALPQGDVSAAQLEVAADLALAYGDGTVRFAGGGHALLRWVRTEEVPALHARLRAAGLARDGAGSAADVVACPGADACRTAVTRTRGIARLVEEEVRGLGGAALEAALPVHVSGCPNGCSQHHLAAIGLQGSARRLGGRAAPQYFVLLGGGARDVGVAFGRLAGKVPARRVPEAVSRLVALFLAEREGGEGAGAFFARAFDRAKEIVAGLEGLGVEDARPEDYVEPGAGEEFRPDAQEGECAA
jgi:sulfite reductase (NADPH) hemoprotein beta-component